MQSRRGSRTKVILWMPKPDAEDADMEGSGQSADSDAARMRAQLDHACAGLRERDEEGWPPLSPRCVCGVSLLSAIVGGVGRGAVRLTRDVSCISQLRGLLATEREERLRAAGSRARLLKRLVRRAWGSRSCMVLLSEIKVLQRNCSIPA